MDFLTGWYPLWLLIFDWALRIVLATHIIMRRRPVAASLAWLAVILFVPIFGLFFYFLVGETRLGSKVVWGQFFATYTGTVNLGPSTVPWDSPISNAFFDGREMLP